MGSAPLGGLTDRTHSRAPYHRGMPDDFWGNAIFSVTPTIVIGLIFWFVMRAIIRADRAERETHAQVEAEERARIARQHAEKAGADPHE